MTLQNAYEYGYEALQQANIQDARIDSFLLLEHICKVTKADYFMEPEKEMTKEEQESYLQGIQKRCQHIPLQHIVGSQTFLGRDFKVNEDVLVPRMETEELVMEVLKYAKDGMKVLDLCTGSGCIAISLKLEMPSLEVKASDISLKALQVARENAASNHACVDFIHSNLLENISEKFDIIVSNPPYIPTEEIDTLMEEVREHEPFIALDGGRDGFDFYRKIISLSPRALAKKGRLLMEIGHDQGPGILTLLEESGYQDTYIRKDLQGLDRIAAGTFVSQDEE